MPVTMTWEGPLEPGEVLIAGVGIDVILQGQSITVSATAAAGMLAGDISWWNAAIDGGTAGSTYTDHLDGGTASTQPHAIFVGIGA
jgi:hypothetical protein